MTEYESKHQNILIASLAAHHVSRWDMGQKARRTNVVKVVQVAPTVLMYVEVWCCKNRENVKTDIENPPTIEMGGCVGGTSLDVLKMNKPHSYLYILDSNRLTSSMATGAVIHAKHPNIHLIHKYNIYIIFAITCPPTFVQWEDRMFHLLKKLYDDSRRKQ